MIFTEVRFFVFFLAVFVFYWLLKTNSKRKFFLLFASYFFYGVWDYRFLSLILLSTVVDYFVGMRLVKTTGVRKRLWLLLSLSLNLGMLALFKYANFFIESANSLILSIGWEDQLSTLAIVLPVGISFYTFQTLSYSIDIYRGKLKPSESLLDFSLFVAFFPQLVAGPIVRASDFLNQLESKRSWQTVDIRWCLILFLCGFFKKACISDNISTYVDGFYANPELYNWISTVCGVVLYSIQIYCDFSGYSDMAIATAGLMGYRLRENFDFPYLAANVTEFWRRWHMSLSSWLRDYLYIPLGGNRNGEFNANRNLMITMLLGGLWHGASWNFVLWGALHGIALIVHKFFSQSTNKNNTGKINFIWGWAVTFTFISLTWVPFRAQNFSDTLSIYGQLTCLNSCGKLDIAEPLWILWILVAALGCFHVLSSRSITTRLWRDVPAIQFSVGYGMAWAISLSARSMADVPFIYFQF